MRNFTRLAVLVLLVAMFVGFSGKRTLADFVEAQKLSVSDGEVFDWFGSGVSVSGDTAVVGVFGEDCAAGEICGAAYIYQFDGTNLSNPQKITASDESEKAWFGRDVSLSGNMALIGARGNEAAYVFKNDGASWVELQKLSASDGMVNDNFGTSISINGDTAVVGATGVSCAVGSYCGAAYVYRFNGSSWIEEQKLVSPDIGNSDQYGISVSVSVDTVVVGARFNGCSAGNTCGAAYVYRYNGSSWELEQKLTPSVTPTAISFGYSVSVSGKTALVGAPSDACVAGNFCGAVYVYQFDGNSWVEQQKIVASDADKSDGFGIATSLSGDTAVIGSFQDDCAAGVICGSAYAFQYDGVNWVEQKLTASDASDGDIFGESVSVFGSTVFVGARQDSCAAGYACGAAYLFNSSSIASAASSPQVAAAPHDMTKDRYLSFNPSTNPGQETALRVTRVGSSLSSYVSCALDYAGVDGRIGQLVQSPEFCEWTNSVIHIRGCEIVPGNEYLVEATADGAAYSSPVSIFTTVPQIAANRSCGDLVGTFENGEWQEAEGYVTANDIVAVVQKFQLLSTAPHVSRVDTDGQTPNGIIAGNDILREVLAFAGGEFGFGVTGCLSGTCVPNCP